MHSIKQCSISLFMIVVLTEVCLFTCFFEHHLFCLDHIHQLVDALLSPSFNSLRILSYLSISHF